MWSTANQYRGYDNQGMAGLKSSPYGRLYANPAQRSAPLMGNQFSSPGTRVRSGAFGHNRSNAGLFSTSFLASRGDICRINALLMLLVFGGASVLALLYQLVLLPWWSMKKKREQYMDDNSGMSTLAPQRRIPVIEEYDDLLKRLFPSSSSSSSSSTVEAKEGDSTSGAVDDEEDDIEEEDYLLSESVEREVNRIVDGAVKERKARQERRKLQEGPKHRPRHVDRMDKKELQDEFRRLYVQRRERLEAERLQKMEELLQRYSEKDVEEKEGIDTVQAHIGKALKDRSSLSSRDVGQAMQSLRKEIDNQESKDTTSRRDGRLKQVDAICKNIVDYLEGGQDALAK